MNYINSESFEETYPNQKARESKWLQELGTTLSGKSIIEECIENQGKVFAYLSAFRNDSGKSVAVDAAGNVQTGTPLITHGYERSKLLYGALAVGAATVFALKLFTRK